MAASLLGVSSSTRFSMVKQFKSQVKLTFTPDHLPDALSSHTAAALPSLAPHRAVGQAVAG